MPSKPSNDPSSSQPSLRDDAQTLFELPAPGDALTVRLEYVAEMLAGAGALPKEPLLVWQEAGQPARHTVIGQQLCVGRRAGKGGLSLEQDAKLSRRHFVIGQAGGQCELEDLQSLNGTAVNRPARRIRRHLLRDGDIILAGSHTFVFLDHGRRQ